MRWLMVLPKNKLSLSLLGPQRALGFAEFLSALPKRLKSSRAIPMRSAQMRIAKKSQKNKTVDDKGVFEPLLGLFPNAADLVGGLRDTSCSAGAHERHHTTQHTHGV